MAECFEETGNSDSDADRAIDKCSFQREQFDIFKHNFREAFDENAEEATEFLTISAEMKRDVVNMARKLQKAQISLASMKENSPIQPVIQKITEIHDQLLQLSKTSAEYSTNNVQLPDFNKSDIDLLFGESDALKSTKNSTLFEDCDKGEGSLEWLRKFNQRLIEKITELMGAAHLLLNEVDEIKRLSKTV
ncbi:hypothetical protein Ddc_05045 [Ditylenchus destructor]|nr:hypothetical protein Ddc_05045 [Ditylenchus destructor]